MTSAEIAELEAHVAHLNERGFLLGSAVTMHAHELLEAAPALIAAAKERDGLRAALALLRSVVQMNMPALYDPSDTGPARDALRAISTALIAAERALGGG